MAEKQLKTFWIEDKNRDRYSHDPIGFGVTAFDAEEAIRIIRNYDYAIPEEFDIKENIDINDLPGWVKCSMHTSLIRGMWYPAVSLGIPKWMVEQCLL